MLKIGDKIRIDEKISLVITKELGEGGQGQVFIVESKKRRYALKLLRNFDGKITKASDLLAVNINNLINLNSPNDAFIWPKRSLILNGQFAYIMELIPEEFKQFSLWLNADEDLQINSILKMIDVSINLILAFNSLRVIGYSYQDINDGNIFINPDTGQIRLCDCDNICPTNSNFGVLGKKGYQAPEVVLGKSPNIYSDLFSLALILYYFWCKDNPFDGIKTVSINMLTDKDNLNFYGKEPVFVWSPEDNSNRPLETVHMGSYYLWPHLPNYIKQGFITTFTKGIDDIQNGRYSMNDWLKSFLTYRTNIIKCPLCDEENIYNYNEVRCDNCHANITPNLEFKINDNVIPICIGTKIYNFHLDLYNKKDLFKIWGEVIESKKYPGILGLRNLTNNVWIQTVLDGKKFDIGYNETAVISNGSIIEFIPNASGYITLINKEKANEQI